MKDVLLLFSGGRDSFLSAALLAEQGYRVTLMSCDNGHTDYIERVYESAKELTDKSIRVLPITKTADLFHKYIHSEWSRKSADRIELYPELQTYQANCTACRLAMYAQAIKYCKENNILYLAEGARKSQGFFIELPEMAERLKSLCNEHGVTLLLPVYDLESDQKRKRMLGDRGLTTKLLEPQCNLGCPMPGPLTKEERRDLVSYFDNELKVLIDSTLR